LQYVKNLQGVSVVYGEERGKLYEPEIGRFFTKKKQRKEKKLSFFQWLCAPLSKCFLSLFISFSSVVMRRSRKKKEYDHAQWRSFIFFFF
jgi:hypothetical protein